MDLGSRLANLSLAEIASMLNAKQQEVLLASISVAARFIQQLQAEEQLQAAAEAEQERRASATEASTECDQDDFEDDDDEFEDDMEELDDDEDLEESYSNEPRPPPSHHGSAATDRRRHSAPAHHTHNKHHRHQSHHYPHHDMTAAESATLLTIKEFADELKARRKAIRLSQKGAAQSLRAFTAGEQPCTDAIIYHFENLQLEPERAMQLIPLLRDWLAWAEKHRHTGKQLPMQCAVTKVPRERKRKVVLFNDKAKQYLEDAFVKNNHPDRYQLDVISQELGIPTRSIRKWFTNRRQRKRFAEKFSV